MVVPGERMYLQLDEGNEGFRADAAVAVPQREFEQKLLPKSLRCTDEGSCCSSWRKLLLSRSNLVARPFLTPNIANRKVSIGLPLTANILVSASASCKAGWTLKNVKS